MSVAVAGSVDSDPVGLAGAAVAELLDVADVQPAEVSLLVLACADPGTWSAAYSSPLLDGEFAAQIVQQVLVANRLDAAVPLGLWASPDAVRQLSVAAASAIMHEETLTCSVAVSVAEGDTQEAFATLLRASPDAPETVA